MMASGMTIAAAMLVASQMSAPDARAQVTYPHVTTQTSDSDTTTRMDRTKVCKASELIGMNLRGKTGDDNIGSINDLVIDHNDGRVKYAAVSFGGFLGMGDKLFAVPLEAIDFVKTDSDAYARIDVSEATLKDKQGFNQDNWPDEADASFAGRVERHVERPATNVPR
jgi:sporulation protein YlmC with PRC-barrel domain